MKVSATLIVLVASSGIVSSLTIPTELQRRDPGDREDPKTVEIDCTDDAAVCNVDCEAILCYGAPNPVQKGAKVSRKHRTESGENTLQQILKMSYSERLERGVDIPDDVLANLGDSPEEAVMAHTEQGGSGDILYPVKLEQNTHKWPDLGSVIEGAEKKAGVIEGDWMLKKFTNYSPNAPYCEALQKVDANGNPAPDDSICPKKGEKPGKTVLYAMMRKAEKGKNQRTLFHMMEPGDKWTGLNWGAQIS